MRRGYGIAAFIRIHMVTIRLQKIHLKTHQNGKPKSEKTSQKTTNLRGRWYDDFVSVEPAKLDETEANAVVQKIANHLNAQALRKGLIDNPKHKRQGHIDAQLETIAKNVHEPVKKSLPAWTEADWEAYFKPCDVVAEIYQAAMTPAKEQNKLRIPRDLAGKTLHAHYAKVFKNDQDEECKIFLPRNFSTARKSRSNEAPFVRAVCCAPCPQSLLQSLVGWQSTQI